MTGRRTQSTLTALAVAVAKQKRPGIYGDGAGLSLVITASGAKRWELRLSTGGQRRQLGLGLYPGVSLDDARRNASALRRDFGQTAHAPSGRRQTVAAAPMTTAVMTFRAAFDDYFEMKAPQLSNPKHAAQWRSTMETYVFPSIDAATWLDRTIVAEQRPAIHEKAFGAEVSKAHVAREDWLIANGLATSNTPGSIPPKPDMLRALEHRGVARVAAKLSAALDLPHVNAIDGLRITGQHVRTIDLPTVRLAVIKGRDEFTFIPWHPEFLKMRGKEIEISIRSRQISMTLARGRSRDRGLSR
jgi:Protein of unknown function (DUF3363)/Arm DNA-binding domain